MSESYGSDGPAYEEESYAPDPATDVAAVSYDSEPVDVPPSPPEPFVEAAPADAPITEAPPSVEQAPVDQTVDSTFSVEQAPVDQTGQETVDSTFSVEQAPVDQTGQDWVPPTLTGLPSDGEAAIGDVWSSAGPPTGCCVVPEGIEEAPTGLDLADDSGDVYSLPGVDTTGTGVADTACLDANGDGVIDSWAFDTTDSGSCDLLYYDAEGAGQPTTATIQPEGATQWAPPLPATALGQVPAEFTPAVAPSPVQAQTVAEIRDLWQGPGADPYGYIFDILEQGQATAAQAPAAQAPANDAALTAANTNNMLMQPLILDMWSSIYASQSATAMNQSGLNPGYTAGVDSSTDTAGWYKPGDSTPSVPLPPSNPQSPAYDPDAP